MPLFTCSFLFRPSAWHPMLSRWCQSVKISLFVCMLGCSHNLRHGHYAWRNRVSWAYSRLTLSAMSSNKLRRSAHIKDACYRPRTTWNLPVIISMKPIILQLITSSFYSQVEQCWSWLILKRCSRFVFFASAIPFCSFSLFFFSLSLYSTTEKDASRLSFTVC